MKPIGRGNSALELLGCVACVAIMGAIIFPVVAQSKTNCGTSTPGLSNVKQCALGMEMYAGDFDDLVPYVRTQKKLVDLVHPYVKDDARWDTCNGAQPGKFRLNPSLPGASLFSLDDPSAVPMLFDIFGHKPTRGGEDGVLQFTLAYADGHGRALSEKAWLKAQPLLYLDLKRHGKPLEP